MPTDEDLIREVVRRWMEATISGDVEAVLELMAEDAVFCTVGSEPFGKEAFASMARSNDSGMSIKGTNEIVELEVVGDWAFTRSYIDISMQLGEAEPVCRSGYAMTIFRKSKNGTWRLSRDANMVTTKVAGEG